MHCDADQRFVRDDLPARFTNTLKNRVLRMAKAKSAFVCTECGAHSVKWAGQCPDCASWNTLSRTAITPSRVSAQPGVAPSTIESLPDDLGYRDSTGFDEFDRVLGGGLVPGAFFLLGGDP